MNASLDEALKEAYARAPAAVSMVTTLELRHPSIEEPLYLVQGYKNRALRLESGDVVTFNAIAFSFTLPKTDDGGLQELQLSMDNLNGRPGEFVELAANFPTPVEVFYRPYLSNDPDTVQMDPPLRLFLLNVKFTDTQVSGRAVPVDFINMDFPSEDYTRNEFPALGNQ